MRLVARATKYAVQNVVTDQSESSIPEGRIIINKNRSGLLKLLHKEEWYQDKVGLKSQISSDKHST